MNNNTNLEEARTFLATLAGNLQQEFYFQTFDDCEDQGHVKDKNLTKVFRGTLNEHFDKLVELNKKGAGIFVQINVSDGMGRKAENIVSCRALFADKDDGKFIKLPLKPTILVDTAKGQHAYWVLKESLTPEVFREMQKRLIQCTDSDKSIHNPDRVMRIPGFHHLKNPANPVLIELVSVDSNAIYSIDELRDSLVPKIESKNPRLEKFLKWIEGLPHGEGQRNSAVLRFVRQGLAEGLTFHELTTAVRNYCDKSGLPIEEADEILDRQVKQHTQSPFRDFRGSPGVLKIVNILDLASSNIPPTDWIIEDFLARGSTSILAAPPKIGKSTLIRQLSIQSAHGIEFVGRKVKPCRVLYFAVEELEYEVLQHCLRVHRTLKRDLPANLSYVFENSGMDALVSLEKAITEQSPDLVVIDPLVFWLSVADTNSYSEVYGVINKLTAISKRFGCHILAVHHTRKGEGNPFEKILGSVALPASFFTLMVMSEDDQGNKYFESRQKAGKWFPKTRLEFSPDTGLFSFLPVVEKTQLERDCERVANAIPFLPNSITEIEIWQRVSLKSERRNEVLNALISGNYISRSGAGRKGNPFRYSRSGNEEVGSTISADSTSLFPSPDESNGDEGSWE